MDRAVKFLANDHSGTDHADTDIVWTVDTFMNDAGQRSKWLEQTDHILLDVYILWFLPIDVLPSRAIMSYNKRS